MSSSITKGSVHEGKLLVHIAENGHSFELDCDETTLVEGVMQYIESVTGINFNEQLVLSSDMKLESQRPLSAYKLPSSDRDVFIFNRAKLQNNSPPPPPERVDILEVEEPPSPAGPNDPHPLDDALDPALKALPSYERQFRYHYHRGHAIYSRSHLRYGHCERLLREQRVQERAIEVARVNLDQYYRAISQNYSEFMKRYKQQHRIHSELLMNYKRDLEKLRSIKLHPALQTTTRKFLIDFVKEENLRKVVENCSNSHRQFERKVSEFKQMFSEVKHKGEELFGCRNSIPIRNLELTMKEHRRFINEQKSVMQSLCKDVNTVKELVDDCLSGQLSSSIRPHDAVAALGPMYDVHDKNHLPNMEACGRSIAKLLEFCKNKKNEMNIFVHNYMQKIAYVTYFIKDAKFQFPVFREAMVHQDDLFMDLKLVRGIGPVYRACLAEVVRRKASMKLYMGMAGQLAERLATMREAEVRRREEFQIAHSSYLPQDILDSMGLSDIPSQCIVNIAPFDTNLLNIDISDLDHYAPEYLMGLPLKSEKQYVSFKGSLSISNYSSPSSEREEIVADTLDKDYYEDLFEGCELLEISGTSNLEVENVKLKAELASAKALICSLSLEIDYESADDNNMDGLLKNAAEKTDEALQLKDEYGKHLQSMLKEKQLQCLSYEKRIQELEQRLSDQFLRGQKLSSSNIASDFDIPASKVDDSKPQIHGDGQAHVPYISTSEPMDEVSCISGFLHAKLGLFASQSSKGREGGDENMMDSSGLQNTQLDSLMMESHLEELQVSDKDGKDKMVGQLCMSLANSSTAESMPEALNVLPTDAAVEPKITGDLMLELQSALAEKSSQLSETESKLKAFIEDVTVLARKLEMSQKLLDESQMNCAHLENCLHEAREEAQTHLCAVERRASEYSALRASAVKMRGLFERLKNCVYGSGGVAGFADSLRALAQSLANSINDNEDDGTAELRKCIRVLADRVSFLSGQSEKLLDEYPKLEASNEQLRKELEEKKELITTLYKKHQLEKQANKERISFGRLEVHEIAAFVLNSAGHYEAITRNCSNYYLSSESVALFADHLPSCPSYIVGQIVHIERQVVQPLLPTSARPEHGRADPTDHLTCDTGADQLTLNLGSTSNPFRLSIGCEYFIVTVAMLPDTTIRSPSPS